MLSSISQNKITVLVYLRCAFHLTMYEKLFSETHYDYVIVSDKISRDEMLTSSIAALPNCLFCTSIDQILYKLNAFGLFLTSDALATSAHKEALRLVLACHKAGIPVVELQHGLFTYGDYYQCSCNNKMVQPDGLPCRSFRDHLLSFSPNYAEDATCIGYPKYHSDCPPSYTGNYTLILSNLHWDAYTPLERYAFMSSILHLANDYQNDLFVWRLHPGECASFPGRNMLNSLFNIFPKAKNNILFTHENRIWSLISVDDIIRKAGKIISTISTVILDCEMYNKKTMVYNAPSVRFAVERFKKVEKFCDYSTLNRLWGDSDAVIETGMLYAWNKKKFEDFVEDKYKKPKDKYSVLDTIFS